MTQKTLVFPKSFTYAAEFNIAISFNIQDHVLKICVVPIAGWMGKHFERTLHNSNKELS